MLYIDLFKHLLHKEKLIQKRVQVHHSNGSITTRLQWVDPNTGKPADSTFNHHGDEHSSVRKYNVFVGHKHKVVHMHIGAIKSVDKNKVDPERVDKYKKAMKQGKKLPPVVLDGHKNVIHGHNRVQAAHELWLSHVPSIVHSDDPEISKIVENTHYKLGRAQPISEEQHVISDKSKRELTFRNLANKIKGKGIQGVGMFNANGHRDIQMDISKHWDSLIKPGIENRIKSDTSASDVSKERQLHMLGYANKRPMYSWLHDKELCKAVNDTIFEPNVLKGLRNSLKSSTLSINMKGNPDKILSEGYISSNLKSHLGEEGYNKFISSLGEDTQPEHVINALEMEHGYAISDRNEVEHDLMGAHPLELDNRPVYVAYNPFNSYRGGAPGFGDPEEGGSVITVDSSILPDCTLTTDDSFLYADAIDPYKSAAMPVAKPIDMEHLSEIWINTHASQIRNTLKSSGVAHPYNTEPNWDNFQNYYDEVHNQDSIQLELQYHNGSHLPPSLLKEWKDNE